MKLENQKLIESVVNKLLKEGTENNFSKYNDESYYMPSLKKLKTVIKILSNIFFPGYFENPVNIHTYSCYSFGSAIENVYSILYDQLSKGIRYSCQYKTPIKFCKKEASSIVQKFIVLIPEIRKMLIKDVIAAYQGDPSAKSIREVIFSFPSVKAMINYRIAHQLYLMKVPIIPRILTEFAHSETGIDIHPGAKIGESFFMDHGTGIVIGETTIIGNNVRIYQGVTLGAKSFLKNRDGSLKKGKPRHPIIGDNVIIYSGTTILGRIKIGNRAIIGGNLWITESVADNIKLIQNRPKETYYFDGEGI